MGNRDGFPSLNLHFPDGISEPAIFEDTVAPVDTRCGSSIFHRCIPLKYLEIFSMNSPAGFPTDGAYQMQNASIEEMLLREMDQTSG